MSEDRIAVLKKDHDIVERQLRSIDQGETGPLPEYVTACPVAAALHRHYGNTDGVNVYADSVTCHDNMTMLELEPTAELRAYLLQYDEGTRNREDRLTLVIDGERGSIGCEQPGNPDFPWRGYG